MRSEISTKVLSAGMVKDTSNLNPGAEGTYLFALNSVLESKEGDYPFISNELGTAISAKLLEGATILGHVSTNTNTIILFVHTPESSFILEYNPINGSVVTLVNTPDLNFDLNRPIKALFRIRKGCERTIYFTDNYNPYRVINIDNLSQYGIPFDVTKLNLYRNIQVPTLEISSIQDFGGNLKVGTYNFAVQYMDEDFNETSFVAFTPTIPIVDDALAGEYYSIDGGVPIIDFADQEGAVPNSTKSVLLQLGNLDPAFKYFRIVALAATATTGEISHAYLLEPQAITSSTHIYTFRSVDPSVATLTDVGYVQNNVFKIDRVGSHAQIDNRLVLANLSYSQLNWASVQQATKHIKVSWRRKEINKEDINSGAAKSPTYYIKYKTFLREEVYAFGIYGVLKDGTNTPVFHIPGREANNFDNTPVSIVPDNAVTISSNQIRLADVEHLGYTISDVNTTIPKWRVHNTATFFGSDPEYALSYWESDIDYPTDLDCEGNRIYPEGKIRHHKMPDSRMLPIENQYAIVPIGLKFDLTNFLSNIPDSIKEQITEWKICRADRTEASKTIIDKGYSFNAVINPDDVLYEGVEVIRANDRSFEFWGLPTSGNFTFDYLTHFYVSPKQMFIRSSYNADYISIERQFELISNPIQYVWRRYIQWASNTLGTPIFNRILDGYSHIDRYKEWDGLEKGTANIVPLYPAVRQNLDTNSVINYTTTVPLLAFKTTKEYDLNSTDLLGGIRGSYIAFKKNNPSIYSNIHNIEYVDLTFDTETECYFGGDIFISKLFFSYSAYGQSYLVCDAYYESEINSELRHEGLINPIIQGYFKGTTADTNKVVEYAKGYYPFDGKYYIRPEYLKLNLDFNRYQKEKALLPLPLGYDYCTSCSDTYPYRIIASEKSFQTEVSDRYRTFKANNFIDISGDCGKLEELVTYNDNLYCLTHNYPVFIPIRPQTLQSNESTVYIGSGEIFAAPYKKLTSPGYKYGGCQNFMSVCNTEFGVYYADSLNGKLFQLNAPPIPLENGMNNWLEENLPFKFFTQFEQLTGIEYPNKYATNGVGLISTFDTRHKRYILTKLDYKLISPDRYKGFKSFTSTPGATNDLYYDTELNVFFTRLDSTNNRKVQFTETAWFENHSWTLSYSPRHKAFVSFHSYIPQYYLNDGNTFYSKHQLFAHIFKHNEGEYQKYYYTKHDHILEFIVSDKPNQVKTFNSIELICEPTFNGVATYKIFDRGVFYTSNQSTGLQPLTLKTGTFQDSTGIMVSNAQKSWKLNRLRNYLIPDLPPFSSNWTDISTNFFIDKVAVNTNPNLSQFDLERLRDRWLGVRLYFKPQENIKLTTNIISAKQNISYR